MALGYRLSKTLTVHVLGVASALKVYHSVVAGRGISKEGITAHMGDLIILGTLSFNAAMSRFSQPHVVHSMEEVASANMKHMNGGVIFSMLKSSSGQAGCLALLSYSTVRGSLFVLDLPLSHRPELDVKLSKIWTLTSNFFLAATGFVLFSVALVPIGVPVFGITYLVGATWGRLLGRRLLMSSACTQYSAGWLQLNITRLYSRHYWLAQAGAFGIAILAYMPMHVLRKEEVCAGIREGFGEWHYSRSFHTWNPPPRHEYDDAKRKSSPNITIFVEEFVDKGSEDISRVVDKGSEDISRIDKADAYGGNDSGYRVGDAHGCLY